ncbi:MAG: prephenate dehydratase [Candidatus Pacebacteria bacterium]|nr:prephenate dehydratase [Candidatus Paceibacterota bacterium]
MKIGIMGEQGSFSEQAARTYCSENPSFACEIDYLVNAERVLSALESGAIDRGIFPIENSNGGIVLEAVHAMSKHNFDIEKMFEIEVKHNLLVFPGMKAADITVITSHDQAIKQCRMYLKRVWPHVDIQVYADTALAAKDIKNGILPPTTAAIASKGAADLYGLDVLDEGIQDLKFNYTTFIAAKTNR